MARKRSLWTRVSQAHDKCLKRRGGEFYNFGWAQTDTGLASKTSLGILDSEIDPITGKITHQFVTGIR